MMAERRSRESRGMIETRESKGVNVQRRNVSALTVTAQIRRRSRDRGAVLQKGKKSKRTCHTRRSLAPSPALHVASLSRSFSLFLSLCPPVWSGPCVIGAESLRFGGTWTVAKKERSRASVDSSEQHRALRYLAGSKIATALSSMVFAALPPSSSPPPSSPLLLLLPLLPLLLLLLLLGPRATGSLEPPGNSLGRFTSSHFYIPRTRSRLSLCFSAMRRRVSSLFLSLRSLSAFFSHSITSCVYLRMPLATRLSRRYHARRPFPPLDNFELRVRPRARILCSSLSNRDGHQPAFFLHLVNLPP
ncbi:uncharacterized protein LOC116415075 [Apis florea]|uniref:uncharacterized protein LOC116415075 n=1 Tax=Apis florea TaxID=7463 RepID=UPI0012FF3710|nr:uncharacterized protein LOC116415075 [Apis florea]